MRPNTVLDLPTNRRHPQAPVRTVHRPQHPCSTATSGGSERRTRSVLVVTGPPVHGWRAALGAARARAVGEPVNVFVVETMLPSPTWDEHTLVADGRLAPDAGRQLGAWMMAAAGIHRYELRTGTAADLVAFVDGTPDDVDVEVTLAPASGPLRRLRTRRLLRRLAP